MKLIHDHNLFKEYIKSSLLLVRQVSLFFFDHCTDLDKA